MISAAFLSIFCLSGCLQLDSFGRLAFIITVISVTELHGLTAHAATPLEDELSSSLVPEGIAYATGTGAEYRGVSSQQLN